VAPGPDGPWVEGGLRAAAWAAVAARVRKVREDLVDRGPLRDAGDEAHRAMAGRAREEV